MNDYGWIENSRISNEQLTQEMMDKWMGNGKEEFTSRQTPQTPAGLWYVSRQWMLRWSLLSTIAPAAPEKTQITPKNILLIHFGVDKDHSLTVLRYAWAESAK